MNPIKLYFASIGNVVKVLRWDKSPLDVLVSNALCSFAFPHELVNWGKSTQNLPGNIIIDSGAFSAWNRGAVVNFDKYINYCLEALNSEDLKSKNIRCVNLDVIPGKKGETKKNTKKIVDESAKKGFDNLLYFKKRGITPIHVFHQGEDFYWLEKMCDYTDYIGISPANDVSQDQKKMWIDKAFSFLSQKKIKIQTHGFAVWSPSVLIDYPWTSCDAASWRVPSTYGKCFFPYGGFSNADYSKKPIMMKISSRIISDSNIRFSDQIEEILKKDGLSKKVLQESSERYLVNIRYYLGLEAWINKQKAKKKFIPKKYFGIRGE